MVRSLSLLVVGKRVGTFLLFGLLIAVADAYAQLRVVTYNTAGGPRPEMEIIFRAIGEEQRNGIAKPIDVLLVQEQASWSTTTQSIVDMLNGIYGANTYGLAMLDGGTTGAGRPGLVYNTSTVQLIEAVAFGNWGANNDQQPRQTLRYQLRPVGYGSSADFYVYNSHYKADTGSTNEGRRLVEATAVRQNADALGAGTHIIYAGDLNFYRGSEPGFQMLISPGDAQAFDPIDRIGDWTDNPSFADVHTQSPCFSGCGDLTGGGMDDRFDFQLVTAALLDGQGFDYIPGSYRAFGNDGSTFNTNINAGCNTISGCLNTYVFSGVTSYTKPQILNALHAASDHVPVVADYQLPSLEPQPQVLARWTFEVHGPSISGTGASFGPLPPEEGSGGASGTHASASTTWSSPVGNGSLESFSSDRWAISDYYQFQVSTTGMEDVRLTFDHASSNTGPRDFRIDYSTNGIDFASTGITYSVLANASPNPVWNSTTYLPQYSFNFDLSSITDLNDQSNIYLRLVMNSTVSANGGTVGTAGTSRIDNVTIWGTPLAGLPGDFNGDGMVDAADYVFWRKTDGTTAQYNTWRANFGRSSSGSGNAIFTTTPEPSAWLLMLIAVCLMRPRGGTLGTWTRPV